MLAGQSPRRTQQKRKTCPCPSHVGTLSWSLLSLCPEKHRASERQQEPRGCGCSTAHLAPWSLIPGLPLWEQARMIRKPLYTGEVIYLLFHQKPKPAENHQIGFGIFQIKLCQTNRSTCSSTQHSYCGISRKRSYPQPPVIGTHDAFVGVMTPVVSEGVKGPRSSDTLFQPGMNMVI